MKIEYRWSWRTNELEVLCKFDLEEIRSADYFLWDLIKRTPKDERARISRQILGLAIMADKIEEMSKDRS